MQTAISADLIIHNVNVITMNPNHPFAIGVAIAHGKIIGLMNENDGSWPLNLGGKEVDGNGLTLMPGLIDAHCHLRAQISSRYSVPCDRYSVGNIREIIQSISKQAHQLDEGKWIRATGYDSFYLEEKRHPDRWDLDKAAPNHPVRLRHVTRHASVLNSAGLSLAGIAANKEDPKGVKVEREPRSGVPTGLIYGGDTWLSNNIVRPLSDNELREGAIWLKKELLNKGLTAVQDATPTNTIEDLSFWASQIKNGWPITLQLMSNEKNHALMSNSLTEISLKAKDKLQMGPLKIVMEASPHIYPEQNELNKIALQTAIRGVPLAVHVVNPEMIWHAVQAIDYANIHTINRIRHRLEHLSLCPEAFIPELKEKGLMVVTNPNLIYNHGDRYLNDVLPSEQDWLYPMDSIIKAGISIAAGSDAPVASFDPWTGIQAAITRKTMSGRVIGSHEKLDRWQALAMYTTGAALAGGWENDRGMIKVSYHADLIALDKDPLTCPVDQLNDIKVHTTWIAGKNVYQVPY